MRPRLERVRSASLRVALISTAITLVAYFVISVVVVMFVNQTLTSQIDNRLRSSLDAIERGEPPGEALGLNVVDPEGTPYGPVLLAWEVTPDGTVLVPRGQRARYPDIPNAAIGPTTTRTQGTEIRVLSAMTSDGRLIVVGQTMASVSQARWTVFIAELIVGGVLLVLVFFGALAVGRRVGAPIELARQRQMEFTADASHELRTPLSVIEAQTSLALSQQRDAAWYRQAFQRVGGESQRIRRLVEDLLWLARVDSPGTTAPAEAVDIAVMAGQAVDRFGAVGEARQLQLASSAGPGSHIISASPEWVDRLLGVLLDNACKYTPDGGRVQVTVGIDGNRVRVTVEDSGPGIPVAERSRIFDRFHRASDLPGAGLGLAIADAVVRLTHGRWEIGTSTALGGASMSVSWPRILAGRQQQQQQQPAIPLPPQVQPQ